jgi:hypothetical protein
VQQVSTTGVNVSWLFIAEVETEVETAGMVGERAREKESQKQQNLEEEILERSNWCGMTCMCATCEVH